MKILVIGSQGRLGAAVLRQMQTTHDAQGLGRDELDLADGLRVLKLLREREFDALINCAALTAVDYCEDHEREAQNINALAPGMMAAVCAEKGARMVHVSTDYVFDGVDPGRRAETDPMNPLGAYGRGKAAGEKAVLAVKEARPLVIRVSWVFGPDRPSFLDSMIHRAIREDSVRAISDKWSSPGYTLDYAQWFNALLEVPEAQGLLHLCNGGAASWQEYAQHGLDCAKKAGLPLKTGTVQPLPLRDAHFFKAPRPVHTVLDTSRFEELTGITPRAWQDAVEEYVLRHADQIRAGARE
jgi:dTDP-4-dehydrorhamnose reductase